MSETIPSNQIVNVECTNKECWSRGNIFGMVVRDRKDPICTNFKGSICPYCNKRSIINYDE